MDEKRGRKRRLPPPFHDVQPLGPSVEEVPDGSLVNRPRGSAPAAAARLLPGGLPTRRLPAGRRLSSRGLLPRRLPTGGLLPRRLPTSGPLPRGLPTSRLLPCGLPTGRLLPCGLPPGRAPSTRRLPTSRLPTPSTATTAPRHLRAADVTGLVDEIEVALFALHSGLGDLLRARTRRTRAPASHLDPGDVALLVEVVEPTRLPTYPGPSNLGCHVHPPLLRPSCQIEPAHSVPSYGSTERNRSYERDFGIVNASSTRKARDCAGSGPGGRR